jgi:hypothetical protein
MFAVIAMSEPKGVGLSWADAVRNAYDNSEAAMKFAEWRTLCEYGNNDESALIRCLPCDETFYRDYLTHGSDTMFYVGKNVVYGDPF